MGKYVWGKLNILSQTPAGSPCTAVEKQTSTLAAHNIFVRVLLVSFINLTGDGSDAMRL